VLLIFPRLCRQEVTGLIQTFVSWSSIAFSWTCWTLYSRSPLVTMNIMSHDLWIMKFQKGNWRPLYDVIICYMYIMLYILYQYINILFVF
jgi:hypothetical protein